MYLGLQSVLNGEPHQIGGFFYTQLEIDVLTVVFHRFNAQVNAFGNLFITAPLPNQGNDLHLPKRQVLQLGKWIAKRVVGSK